MKNTVVDDKQPLSAETLVLGGKYNWKYQKERLVYRGKKGAWHQFALVAKPYEVWCEVLSDDLHMLEETK